MPCFPNEPEAIPVLTAGDSTSGSSSRSCQYEFVTKVGLGAILSHAKKTFDASFQDGLVQQGGEEGAHR